MRTGALGGQWRVFGKSLDATKRKIFHVKNPLPINGAVPRRPSFSNFFFGRFQRFQWFSEKKIWKTRRLNTFDGSKRPRRIILVPRSSKKDLFARTFVS
jgi:hypothetical protein